MPDPYLLVNSGIIGVLLVIAFKSPELTKLITSHLEKKQLSREREASKTAEVVHTLSGVFQISLSNLIDDFREDRRVILSEFRDAIEPLSCGYRDHQNASLLFGLPKDGPNDKLPKEKP